MEDKKFTLVDGMLIKEVGCPFIVVSKRTAHGLRDDVERVNFSEEIENFLFGGKQ